MKLVSPYDAVVKLHWNYNEWHEFVLSPARALLPAETEAGRLGIHLKLPCGLVVTLTSSDKNYLIDKILESSIEDALEWDAKRRLGIPPVEDVEIEVDDKLFKVLVGDVDKGSP